MAVTYFSKSFHLSLFLAIQTVDEIANPKSVKITAIAHTDNAIAKTPTPSTPITLDKYGNITRGTI